MGLRVWFPSVNLLWEFYLNFFANLCEWTPLRPSSYINEFFRRLYDKKCTYSWLCLRNWKRLTRRALLFKWYSKKSLIFVKPQIISFTESQSQDCQDCYYAQAHLSKVCCTLYTVYHSQLLSRQSAGLDFGNGRLQNVLDVYWTS